MEVDLGTALRRGKERSSSRILSEVSTLAERGGGQLDHCPQKLHAIRAQTQTLQNSDVGKPTRLEQTLTFISHLPLPFVVQLCLVAITPGKVCWAKVADRGLS